MREPYQVGGKWEEALDHYNVTHGPQSNFAYYNSLFDYVVYHTALVRKQEVTRHHYQISEEKLEGLLQVVSESGFAPVIHEDSADTRKKDKGPKPSFYIHEHGLFVWHRWSWLKSISIEVVSLGGKVTPGDATKDIVAYLREFEVDPSKKSYAHLLVQDANSFQIQSSGEITHIHNPLNYAPEVNEGWGRVVDAINNQDLDRGRLVLLQGPPGTGKTYLIRSLFGATKGKSKCVVVPPDLVTKIADPSLIPVFLKASKEDRSLVLILEDADKALVPRMADNMSAVEAILNLTDGILGHMMNIVIIASSNSKVIDVDPAVRRSGRLLESIRVGALSAEHAQQVYNRLTEGKGTERVEHHVSSKSEMTLANIFSLARDGEIRKFDAEKEKPDLGFG